MAKDFSVGRDVSLDVVDPVLGVIRFAIKSGWKSEPQWVDLKVKQLSGEPIHDTVPDGHSVTFDLERKDATVESYFAAREEAYFNGAELSNVQITETIKERNGSITQFRYTGVSLKLTGAGTWAGNETTKQTVTGFAARKRQIL